MCSENETSKNVMLDDVEITTEQLDERLRNLKKDEKIVETSKDNFQTLSRMHG